MEKKFLTPRLIKFLIIAAICLLLIFFNPKGLFDPVRGVFLEVAYPFQKTFYLMGNSIAGAFNFLGSIGDLKTENSDLLKENNSLASEIAGLKDVKKENDSLREQLNLAPKGKFNLETALIIGQDPQRLGSWVALDKGANNGIQAGRPVIVSSGILVGKVEESYPGSAKVTLLTDSGSAINAVDLETGAKGIIKGTYGLGITMDMISQADVVNQGDTIVTSGLGGEMPKGLLIGKVQEVRISSDKLFQQALIIPSAKYSNLDVVSVIKN